MALFEGAARRMDRAHDERMELAWTIVMLPQQKKKLRLKDLLSQRRRTPARQDPRAEFARWEAWAASYSRN